jgi:ElaB/YqjD/DUF883 family membrane-anchored ribosome-binding protein
MLRNRDTHRHQETIMALNDPFDPSQQPDTSSSFDTQSRSPIDKEAHRRNLHDAQRALRAEFQTLIGDAERLLNQTKGSAGGQTEELRGKITENIERAKSMLKDSEASVREQGQAAKQATEDYLYSHPWQSLGIAAGVGFLLGLLTAPRR